MVDLDVARAEESIDQLIERRAQVLQLIDEG